MPNQQSELMTVAILEGLLTAGFSATSSTGSTELIRRGS